MKARPLAFVLVGLIVLAALAILLAPAEAQQAGKVPRIGMLMPVPPASAASNIAAFRQGLRERGYVEGESVVIDYRYADGTAEPLPRLAAELIDIPVDVIVTWGTPAAQAAQRATRAVPIVMAAAADPVGTGLVTSLARPGGNLTGVATDSREYFAKILDLLVAIVPKASLVAVLWDPNNAANAIVLKELRAAAGQLGVTLHVIGVRGPDDFDTAFAAVTKARPAGALALNNPLFLAHRSRITGFGMKNRLPVVYARREYVDAGGLMSYGTNFRDNFRRAAAFVDKVLKGAKPADLPVEEPTKYELVINLKTAKALGLTIPPSLLLRADQLIE